MTPLEAACVIIFFTALFVLVILMIDMCQEYRQKEKDYLEERLQDHIQEKLDEHIRQDQDERQKFQNQLREANKDAWKAVQEMVSTARDLAYMEQHKK